MMNGPTGSTPLMTGMWFLTDITLEEGTVASGYLSITCTMKINKVGMDMKIPSADIGIRIPSIDIMIIDTGK